MAYWAHFGHQSIKGVNYIDIFWGSTDYPEFVDFNEDNDYNNIPLYKLDSLSVSNEEKDGASVAPVMEPTGPITTPHAPVETTTNPPEHINPEPTSQNKKYDIELDLQPSPESNKQDETNSISNPNKVMLLMKSTDDTDLKVIKPKNFTKSDLVILESHQRVVLDPSDPNCCAFKFTQAEPIENPCGMTLSFSYLDGTPLSKNLTTNLFDDHECEIYYGDPHKFYTECIHHYSIQPDLRYKKPFISFEKFNLKVKTKITFNHHLKPPVVMVNKYNIKCVTKIMINNAILDHSIELSLFCREYVD